MSNPCRLSCETDPRTGVCRICDHAYCAGCERAFPAEAIAQVQWVPGEDSPGHVCDACLVGDDGDSGGVPVEVPEEETSAQTVRLETPSTGELVAEWIERLYAAEAA